MFQGRVLYDTVLYNAGTSDEPCVLMECDKEVVPEFIKLMKRYKIRKKVRNFFLKINHIPGNPINL